VRPCGPVIVPRYFRPEGHLSRFPDSDPGAIGAPRKGTVGPVACHVHDPYGSFMGRGPGANRVRHERPESYLRYRSSDSLPLIAERQSLSLFPAAASTLRVRPASPRFNRSTAFAVTGCRLSPIEWFSPPMAEASSVRAAFAAGPVRRSARLGVNHGSQSNFPPAVGHFCLSTASASPGLAFTCP